MKKIILDSLLALDEAIYATLGEGTDQVQLLIQQRGSDLRDIFKTEQEERTFLRDYLQQHWSKLTETRRLDLRHALQYLLNLDEPVPYVTDKKYSNLKSKKGSLVQHIRDSCQDAMTPYDGYELCQWMWEILFDNEDWHTDIGNWIVTKK